MMQITFNKDQKFTEHLQRVLSIPIYFNKVEPSGFEIEDAFYNALNNISTGLDLKCGSNFDDRVYKCRGRKCLVFVVKNKNTIQSLLLALNSDTGKGKNLAYILNDMTQFLQIQCKDKNIVAGDSPFNPFVYEDMAFCIILAWFLFSLAFDIAYGTWDIRTLCIRFHGYGYGFWYLNLMINPLCFPFKSTNPPFSLMTCNMSQYSTLTKQAFKYSWWLAGFFGCVSSQALAWEHTDELKVCLRSDQGWLEFFHVVEEHCYFRFAEFCPLTFCIIFLLSLYMLICGVQSTNTISSHETGQHFYYVYMFSYSHVCLLFIQLVLSTKSTSFMSTYQVHIFTVCAILNLYPTAQMLMGNMRAEYTAMGGTWVVTNFAIAALLGNTVQFYTNLGVFLMFPVYIFVQRRFFDRDADDMKGEEILVNVEVVVQNFGDVEDLYAFVSFAQKIGLVRRREHAIKLYTHMHADGKVLSLIEYFSTMCPTWNNIKKTKFLDILHREIR